LKSIDVVLLSIATPVKVGIYYNNKLIEEISMDGKSSDVLEPIFKKIFYDYSDVYSVNSISYINTPGSFMAIKMSYIFLKTLSVTYDIKLKAVDGFYFNNGKPIKAIGNRYFIKDKNKIILDKIAKDEDGMNFELPEIINLDDFSDDIEPDYVLPSV
jgi:hypothetical protein